MARYKEDLLNGVIWQQIIIFFIPVFFGTIFQQLYNTVDAMVVGNFVGKQALGAVGGSTGTVLNLLVGFVTGLASGATVVIAQYYGNQEREKVKKAVQSGMFLAIVLGAILMILGFIFAGNILNILNVPSDMFLYSKQYLIVYLSGLIPTMIYNTGAGVLRAVGDSKRPLYFLIVSTFVNIILDILFVVYFHWGVIGAAIATVLSVVVSCMLTLYTLKHTDECYQFKLKELTYDWPILKRIIIIGLPTGIQSSLYSIANLFIQTSVNGFGTDTVAAYTAFGKIDAIFWNASGAYGTACLTFAGQNFGAGNIERVKKGIKQAILMDVIGSIAISLVCIVCGGMFFRIFTPDQSVIEIGLSMLMFLAPYWFTFAGIEVLSSSIRACGDSFIPMLMTMLGIGLFRILWILFYPSKTILQALTCYPISWILTSILFIGYYFHGGWLKRSLNQRSKLMESR